MSEAFGSVGHTWGNGWCLRSEAIDLHAVGSPTIPRDSPMNPDLQGRCAADLAPVGGEAAMLDDVVRIVANHGSDGTVEQAARILKVGSIVEIGPAGGAMDRRLPSRPKTYLRASVLLSALPWVSPRPPMTFPRE